jgi:hypothetical protein
MANYPQLNKEVQQGEIKVKLYRFSHKTGSYGVTIVEENGDDVLVKVEQVIKKSI